MKDNRKRRRLRASPLGTQRAFECMARIAPHTANILRDAQLLEAKRSLQGEGMAGPDIMQAAYPLLLGRHSEDIVAIAAALAGKTADEVRAQSVSETVRVLRNGLTKEMIDFFPFAASMLRMMW